MLGFHRSPSLRLPRAARPRALRWLAPCLALLLAACGEPTADLSQPQAYHRDGVRMQIPGNWKLVEDERVDGDHYLTVESPGAAVFLAMVQAGPGLELADFARSFSSEAQKGLPAGMSGRSRFEPGAADDGVLREHYEVSLAGVRVPHQREYRRITGAHRTAYLITQSATEDLARTQPGFDLLLKSFALSELRREPGEAASAQGQTGAPEAAGPDPAGA